MYLIRPTNCCLIKNKFLFTYTYNAALSPHNTVIGWMMGICSALTPMSQLVSASMVLLLYRRADFCSAPSEVCRKRVLRLSGSVCPYFSLASNTSLYSIESCMEGGIYNIL